MQEAPDGIFKDTGSASSKVFEDIAVLAAGIGDSPLCVLGIMQGGKPHIFLAGRGYKKQRLSLANLIETLSHRYPETLVEGVAIRADKSLNKEVFFVENRTFNFLTCMPVGYLEGHPQGILCLLYKKNRKLSSQQKKSLQLLAERVVQLLGLYRSRQEMGKLNERLQEASKLGKLGYWELDIDSGALFWSDEVYAIWEQDPEKYKVSYDAFLKTMYEEDRPGFEKAQQQALENKAALNIQHRIRMADGRVKWVHERAKLEFDTAGKPKTLKGSVQDITEEKLREIALSQHVDFIETTLDNLPIGIAVNRISDGKATYMNARFSEIYGWPAKILSDVEQFFEKVYPDKAYRREMKKRVLEDIASGNPARMEWKGIEIRTRNKEKKIINAKNIPLPEQDLMISTVVDITHASNVRKQLAAMNERYKYVSKATSDTIWDRNLTEKELYWGENYTRNLGYRDQANPKNSYLLWFNRIHPDDRKRVEDSFRKALKGDAQNWNCQYRYKHFKAQRYVHVDDRGFLIRNEKGKALRMVGAMQDVTEKYQREQRLKLFESVVAHSNDAIVITRAHPLSAPDGPIITYVNRAFEKMTGYSQAEVVGRTPRFLQGQKTDPATLETLRNHLQAFKPVEVDLVNYRKDGEAFWVNLSIAPIVDSKGEQSHFISIQREINLAKAEHENRELINQLSRDLSMEGNDQEVLDRIARTVCEKINAEAAEIWLINENKTAIELVSSNSPKADIDQFLKTVPRAGFKSGQGLPGNIWKNREGLVIRDLSKENSGFERKAMARQLGSQAAYGIPLLSEHQIIGALLVFSATAPASYKNLMEKKLQGLDHFLGAEIRRKKAQQQLEALIASVPDIICLAGPDGYFKQINQSATDILGYSQEELLSRPFSDFLHPEDQQRTALEFQKLLSGGAVDYFENRYLSKEGETIWIAWSANTANSEGNYLSVGKNITEQKKAQEQIRRSHERFLMASEATNDAIWEWKKEEDTLIWMEGFNRLFGYAPGDNYSMRDWEAKIHPEDRAAITALLEQTLKDENATDLRAEYRFKRKNGTYASVIDQARIIRDGKSEVTAMVGAIQDITDRKKYERELVRLNRSLLEKNEKLALSNTELEHFAYVASHDLQEPLRMISGFLAQLNKKYGGELDEKAQTYIHFAVDGARRMRSIIQDLLEYSRLGRQEEAMEMVSIAEIIEGVEVLYRQLLSESGGQLLKPEKLPRLYSHRVLLFQLFQNLIDNALKYRRKDVPPIIRIGVEELRDHWQFSIQDNGIGIESVFFDKIFAIFQRLHPSEAYEGTGMGLANAKKIVESLGGSIHVQSTFGQGSEFTFSIRKATAPDH